MNIYYYSNGGNSMEKTLSGRQKELEDLLDKDTRSERAKSIMEHPELMDSIVDTDPIWNELFNYINGGPICLDEDKCTVQEKIRFIRRKLTFLFSKEVSRDV
jgi:hypothetical protein